MCTGGYLMPSFDEKGEYNLNDNMIYMQCNSLKHYDAFKKIINSKLVNYLNTITMTDGLHGRDIVVMNLKKINLDKICNDIDIYNLYNISKEEINVIEQTLNK